MDFIEILVYAGIVIGGIIIGVSSYEMIIRRRKIPLWVYNLILLFIVIAAIVFISKPNIVLFLHEVVFLGLIIWGRDAVVEDSSQKQRSLDIENLTNRELLEAYTLGEYNNDPKKKAYVEQKLSNMI